MRTMKDSGIEWIGQIPQAWKVARVKHLATQKDSLFLDGDWINSDIITTEGIRYLTSGNVGEGVYKEQGNGHISEETFKKLNCLKAFPGDLMISRLNEPVGRCCIIPDGHPFYVVAVDNVILRPDNGYNKEFIMYCMNTQGYAHTALMAASGTTMVRISRTSLGNLTIPVASVEEQNRIVEYLDTKCADIDALVAAKEKTNSLLKERRQSIIYEAVTKGLNPDAPMKDSGVERIGMIPETWRVAPLRRFATIRSGLTLGKRYPADTKLVEYPYLRVANVQGEYTDLTDVATVQVTENEAKLYALHAGELLMTEGGDRDKLGRGCVWEGEISPCLHQNHVFALTTNEDLNIYYVDYLTTSDVGRSYFDFTAKKTTNLASTNASTIMAFPIPVPPRDEQDAIVSYLREKCAEIDRLIAANEQTISKLKEYRQSIIYEAVTGKIEV